MIAGLRHADFEEVGIVEHRRGGRIAAARVAVDAGAIEIDPREARRQLLHARDLIGQRVVAHVAVPGLVERTRSPRRPHPVDLHDDETELGDRLRVAACGRESPAADAAGLRSRIDVVDDRIPPRRIEVRRPEHQAVEIGLAVARFHRDRHRRLPARRHRAARCRLVSSATTTLPLASRTTDTGGTSGVEYVSTKYLPDGDRSIV